MASIRQAAQNVLSEARDGIAWIALWKEGKGWASKSFWPDYDEPTERFAFDDDDLEQLRSIFRKDVGAILVNSYYMNLGDPETMTRDSLADALRWQYESEHSMLWKALQNCAE